MMSLLSSYAVPLIGTAILGLFAKPGEKTVWENLLSVVVKPKPKPGTPPSNDVLSLLPSLLEQLLHKTPPGKPDVPLPPADPKNPQDLVAYILSLLSVPSPTKPDDVEVVLPLDEHDDLASLVACANAVAKANPEYDIIVTITVDGGAEVKKVPHSKPKVSRAKS